MVQAQGLILGDSGPLYAAGDRSDQYHKRARSEMAWLEKYKWTVAVAYPTLLETQRLALYKVGHRSARRFLQDLLAGVALINPSANDYERAMDKLREFSDQELTLHDCTLAALSERLGLPVWTYDHHFDVMKTRVWRPA